jgi:hypothetical protein
MEGVGLTGPHVSPDRAFGGPNVTFSNFNNIWNFDPHVSNLDRTIGLAGREENVYLGPERTR